jgi:hypothetical protein
VDVATEELEKHVEQERQELEALPRIPIATFQAKTGLGEPGRCGWCGQFSDDLVIAEAAVADAHGNVLRPARYKGAKCCGGRHL